MEDQATATAPVVRMTDKVIIKRWPDAYTVMGPPILIKDLDDAADLLAQSAWMRTWVSNKIKEAIRAGELLSQSKRIDENWKGREDGVVSEWKLASEQEVLDYVDSEKFANVTGHAVSRRSQEKGYVLHYHEGPALIEAYDKLPRQAREILDMLNEVGRESFTEASIEVIMVQGGDRLKTRQDPMRIFTFYRGRLISEGHLEEVE